MPFRWWTTLPAQIDLTAVTPDAASSDGTCTGLTCTWPLIPAGGSRTVQITGTIKPESPRPAANSVTVSSSTSDPDATNNTAKADVDTTTLADVSVDKSGPAIHGGWHDRDLHDHGSQCRTIERRQCGGHDLLPAGVVPRTVSPEGANCAIGAGGNPQRVRCAVGTMVAPASPSSPTTVTVTIVADVVAAQPAGPVSNTATVTSDTPDDDPSNNRDTVVTEIERLTNIAVTKTAVAATGVVGQHISYDITVSNATGASTAEGVVIADPVPAGTTFVSAVATAGTAHVQRVGRLGVVRPRDDGLRRRRRPCGSRSS